MGGRILALFLEVDASLQMTDKRWSLTLVQVLTSSKSCTSATRKGYKIDRGNEDEVTKGTEIGLPGTRASKIFDLLLLCS